jgi:hypothetical protein
MQTLENQRTSDCSEVHISQYGMSPFDLLGLSIYYELKVFNKHFSILIL